MALYHLHAKTFSRASGQSAVASASYRSGQKLHDYRIGQTFDYQNKQGIIHTQIIAPDNSPSWVADRETLWNQVEKAEKRKDSQLAREIEVALPRELTQQQNLELVRGFVKDNFVSQGMVADIAIHESNADDGKKNPHAHIMLTLREMTPEGLSKKKNRDWNKKETLEDWRKNWANMTNDFLSDAGSTETIDHRTLEQQGIDRKPTFHLGHEVTSMERKGFLTVLGDRLRKLIHINKAVEIAKDIAATMKDGRRERFLRYSHYMNQREQTGQELDDKNKGFQIE